MTGTFSPRLDILPPAQQRLWPKLSPAASAGFVLYGGTAIALRLGHRPSIDFDFFTDQPLDKDALRSALPIVERATVLQDRPETLTVLVADEADPSQTIKLSFFAGLDFGRVGEPQMTDDGVLSVASLTDLFATKLKVIFDRIEAKDYLDVAAMLTHGADLAHGLAAARVLFGTRFQPSECLKALVYFEGGDLSSVAEPVRRTLVDAVKRVANLPRVERRSSVLASGA